MQAETGGHLPGFGLDGHSLPSRQWLAIAEVCQKMDSLGCEITRVHRGSGFDQRWDVEWRAKDRRISPIVYGASGATPLAAARSALANAQSDLREAPLSGSRVGAAPISALHTAATGSEVIP